jgi:glycosyltransferase involved in cell wall biosynthesis
MRICFISTYPPTECGIATYTQYLSDALKQLKNEVLVISEYGGKGEGIFPAYSRTDNDIAAKLFEMTSKLSPEVIHIQHEYGMFNYLSGVQIVDFIIRCKMNKIPVIITLHTVMTVPHEYMEPEKILLDNFIHNSSAVIVHELNQRETLKGLFEEKAKICRIPHGVRHIQWHPDKKAKAKELLGLKDKKVILLIGYLRDTKGLHKIVEIFPQIADKIDNAVLLIASKVQGFDINNYTEGFFKRIEESPVEDRIHVLSGQFPQFTFDTILSTADVIALPYDLGGQSGIMAHASAFHVPVVTSNLMSFLLWNEETKGGLVAHDLNDYAAHICKILSDGNYAKSLQENIKKSNKKREWSEIANQHLLVYQKVMNFPYKKAKYFYTTEEDFNENGNGSQK